jgi:thioredoxin 1
VGRSSPAPIAPPPVTRAHPRARPAHLKPREEIFMSDSVKHDESWLLKLDERNFDETIAVAPGVLMVDFWAEWCGPCRAVAPVLEDLARTSGGKVTLGKVNVDDNPGLAARFGIRSIPTILFVKDGVVKDQVIGAVPKQQLQARLTTLSS